MNWTLEVVVVPVSDVDRAKAFHAEQLGFNVDHDIKDTKVTGGKRIVQLTPPGSGCSIVVGAWRSCRSALRSRGGYTERSLRSFGHLAGMHHRLAGTLLGAPQAAPVVLGHNAPLSRRLQELGAQGWRAAKEKPRVCAQSRPIGPFASPGDTPVLTRAAVAGTRASDR
jgi:hypothetical protein